MNGLSVGWSERPSLNFKHLHNNISNKINNEWLCKHDVCHEELCSFIFALQAKATISKELETHAAPTSPVPETAKTTQAFFTHCAFDWVKA